MDSDGSGKEKRPHRDDDCAGREEYEELRFIVLGKTGVGKSSSINTIVGKDVCKATISSHSVTKQCQLVEEDVQGKHLVIVDTPGLYDTSEDETRREIAKILGLTTPGFHAFIVVIRIGRFTKEEIQSVHSLADIFGPELYERTVVLFTGTDDLEEHGFTLQQHLRDNTSKDLKEFIIKCGGRVAGFNNHTNIKNDKARQVDELMLLIGVVSIAKWFSYYTNQMYEQAKLILETEENRRLGEEPTRQRSAVRREIRHDIAEETALGNELRRILIDKVVIPAANYLADAAVKVAQDQIQKLCVLS